MASTQILRSLSHGRSLMELMTYVLNFQTPPETPAGKLLPATGREQDTAAKHARVRSTCTVLCPRSDQVLSAALAESSATTMARYLPIAAVTNETGCERHPPENSNPKFEAAR